MDLDILYEDKDILAINKPAGLIVHSDGRTEEPSVVEWLLSKYPEAESVGEPLRLKSGQTIARPGIVHRIDRETSGVLLLAKTEDAHAFLKKQFQNREIEKTYHTFVYGYMKDDHGRIDMEISRTKNIPRKWVALPHGSRRQRGTLRAAITYWRVLSRGEDGGERFSLIEAKPKTGRTHQIRVHFRALHHPVVGDKIYAPKKDPILGFSRLALHAREITFTDLKGERHKLIAQYPTDFQVALDKVGMSVVS